MKLCIFGGQYGSEGKGSASEWLYHNTVSLPHPKTDPPNIPKRKLVAIGENSPNSGHTCTLGKTRNIPSVSFWADTVLLGPDSAIECSTLLEDLRVIHAATGKAPRVCIHENAALVSSMDKTIEAEAGLIRSISSTGSGSGAARAYRKQFRRDPDAVIENYLRNHDSRSMRIFDKEGFEVTVVSRHEYLKSLDRFQNDDCIFECSQGTLLDVNWGIYPYVTSRTTLPRVAIERNGLASLGWAYFGVYRTYPIRTGGPSGPTGGQEVTFESIRQPDEIATVTKRVRRIFEFSKTDFILSLDLTRPVCVMFTHLDYIGVQPENVDAFLGWLSHKCGGKVNYRVEGLFLSNQTGQFINHGVQDL